jgi:pimeloyl-ACP methyl ester carboxylesterase
MSPANPYAFAPRTTALGRLGRLSIAIATLLLARGIGATTDVAPFFLPPAAGLPAISADGRYAAYAWYPEDGRVSVAIVELDHPAEPDLVRVPREVLKVPGQGSSVQTGPVRLIYLGWTRADRLIYATPGALCAVDADGRHFSEVVDAERFRTSQAVFQESVAENADTEELAMEDPDATSAQMAMAPQAGSIRVPITQGPTTVTTVAYDRPIRRVWLPAGDPGHAVLEAGGTDAMLFRVDLGSGATQLVYKGGNPGPILCDQLGRPRLAYSGAKFPLRFLDLDANARGRRGAPEGLDALLGRDLGPGFQITADTYFGHRSFPIGFDHDPNLLYFASNVGRDTYGIYELDLRTRRRTGFVAEVPGFDLASVGGALDDSMLVFEGRPPRLVGFRATGPDRRSWWIDPALGRIQADLNADFPGRVVVIAGWDDARRRFVVDVEGHTSPGRYFVYDRVAGTFLEIARLAPGEPADTFSPSQAFAFAAGDGTEVTGYLTLPLAPRISPPALVVILPDLPFERSGPGFNPDAQALASMGIAVLEVNPRGSPGAGVSFREAIRGGFDRIPLSDALAAVGWAEGRFPVDKTRVAVFGRGYGGYLALRAMQLFPDRFKAAVAIGAPTDLAEWRTPAVVTEMAQASVDQARANSLSAVTGQALDDQAASETAVAKSQQANLTESQIAEERIEDAQAQLAAQAAAQAAAQPAAPPEPSSTAAGPAAGAFWSDPILDPNLLRDFRWAFFGRDAGRLRAISPVAHPELFRSPVFLIEDPNDPDVPPDQVRTLRDQLTVSGSGAEYLETGPGFARGLPEPSNEVFGRIAEFFNLTLYPYGVKLGPLKVLK